MRPTTIAKGNTRAALVLAGRALCESLTVDGREVLAGVAPVGPDAAGHAPVGVELRWPDAGLPSEAAIPSLTWTIARPKHDHVVATTLTAVTAASASACGVTVEVRVGPGTLTVSTTIEPARGRVPAVFALSACLAPPAPPDACTLALPGGRELVLDELGRPTGASEPVLARAHPLASSAHGCYEVGPRATCGLSGGGRTVGVMLEEGFPVLDVTPPVHGGACIVAAKTAPPGAIGTGGHRWVTRGKPYTTRLSIRVTDAGART
jgi:hypothetical protein